MPTKSFFSHLATEFELPLQNPILVFSLILIIILLSPVLLRKLRIPGLIGLIISGMIVGPNGMNLLEKNSAVDLFSTIGLLYIMFIAGLELEINEFKANRKSSLVFGLFTFFIPLFIGFPVCYYFLGYNQNASLLISGMFSTHTLVAYPIVSKWGISKNRSVAIAVGGTILTDSAVLILLPVVMGRNQGEMGSGFFMGLIMSLVLFAFIMFYLIPRLARWFFRKLESEKHSHYIFVLAVVFLAAFMAQVAGVEPIIGAFVSGLALNRLIPPSSALMNRIEFIGSSLFIPFFLISVGMLVDISVVMEDTQALMVAGTLSVVALSGKWLAAFFTQLSFGYSGPERRLIFGLSGAHAAATLAIILIGYRSGILDKNVLNGTILLIMITCLVASFVTERAARQIVLQTENDDRLAPKPVSQHQERILLAVANPANVEKLLEFSQFIRNRTSASPISILTVLTNLEEAEASRRTTRRKLEEHVKHASAAEVPTEIITAMDYNPASGIVRVSRHNKTDIIVLGWPEKTGLLDKLVGEKLEVILSGTSKTIFICQFKQSVLTHKHITCVIPPLADLEIGFRLWLSKINLLAGELKIPLKYLHADGTEHALLKTIDEMKFRTSYETAAFNNWNDLSSLISHLNDNDLLVFVATRKGATSYQTSFENLPEKLGRLSPLNNKIIIYPQQFESDHVTEHYGDVSAEPLHKGIEVIQKLGKGLGSIFRGE